MLGKRFHRTTSMSQLGPQATCNHPSSADKKVEKNRASCAPHKAIRPLMDTQSVGIEGWCGGSDMDCGDDANMAAPHEFDPSYHEEISVLQVHEEISPVVPYQMGLWTHQNMGFMPHLAPGKVHRACADATIAPVDFLDVCFFCKRRLRHERDIFIYRGDSAFCSEECRHRQILSDESRSSLRGVNKRGGRAASSETAVAA